MPWNISKDDWRQKLQDNKDGATKAIDDTFNDDSGAWQHAANLGVTAMVRATSIKYAT